MTRGTRTAQDMERRARRKAAQEGRGRGRRRGCRKRRNGSWIGGLAVWWDGHRDSTDLDVFVPLMKMGRRIGQDEGGGSIGMENQRLEVPARKLHTFDTWAKLEFEEGEVDIIGKKGKMIPRKHSGVYVGERKEIELELPRELIAKKMYYRGHETHIRDVYDWAVAAVIAPRELKAAVGVVPMQVVGTIMYLPETGDIREEEDKRVLNPKYPDLVGKGAGVALEGIETAQRTIDAEREGGHQDEAAPGNEPWQ